MRLRDEAGFTLTELLVAMSLMIIVLTATLTTLDSFATTNQRNLTLNDMRENARQGVDTLAKELRNVGTRSGQDSSVERAGPLDLVFEDVDPSGGGSGVSSARRVRYCLEETTAKTGSLWRQDAGWTATLPASTTCPDAAFGSQKLVAAGVVNHAVLRDGVEPPIFSYDAADLSQLATIGTELFVDTDVDRDPATTDLNTSVRIRNRNRAPTAAFTASAQGNRHVLLNGGSSSDPEGQQLYYDWSCAGSCPSLNDLDGLQVADYQVPLPAGASHTFSLTVRDPGDLTSPSTTQTLVVP